MAEWKAEWKKLTTLGEGSYGIVSQAAIVAPQELSGDIIAVKSSKPNMFYSLQREGCILESFFGCKEILQCIWSQVTVDNDHLTYNLLTEYAPFGSLGDLIKKRPLCENEVRVYTRMLLKGLYRIHQHGVVHCDLKPDNILLFPSSEYGAKYQLKIADFGLSRTKDEKFNADFWKIKFRGTPIYMSPESVMGQIEAPLDIWSLGCIVIEMLTGSPALKLHALADIMFKLAFLKEAPMIPNEVSENCKDFLNKCFVKDPTKRWTADMLLHHPFLDFSTSDRSEDIKRPPMSSFSFFSYDIVT